MNLCPKCRSEYPEELNFCRKDGTALTRKRDEPTFVDGVAVSAEESTATETTRRLPTCTSCGAPIAADQVFCRRCGRKLQTQPRAAISPELTAKIDAVRQQLASDPSKALAMPEFGEVEQHLMAIHRTGSSGDAATLLAEIEETRGDAAKERGDLVEALARYRNSSGYDPNNESLVSKLAAVVAAQVEKRIKHREALYSSLRRKALLPGIFSALVLVGYFLYEPLVSSLAQRGERPAPDSTRQPSTLEPSSSHGPGSTEVAASTVLRSETAAAPAGQENVHPDTGPAASSTAVHREEGQQVPAALAQPTTLEDRSVTPRAAEKQAAVYGSTSTAPEASTAGQTPAFAVGSAPVQFTPKELNVESPHVASVPPSVSSPNHVPGSRRQEAPTRAQPDAVVEGWYDVVYGTTLLSEPHEDASVITHLRSGTKIHVVAAAGRFLRVESTTGRPPGFVARDHVSHIVSEEDTVAGWYKVVSRTPVLSEPNEDASVITSLRSGKKVHVIGAAGNFLRVESIAGRAPGFIARDDLSRIVSE